MIELFHDREHVVVEPTVICAVLTPLPKDERKFNIRTKVSWTLTVNGKKMLQGPVGHPFAVHGFSAGLRLRLPIQLEVGDKVRGVFTWHVATKDDLSDLKSLLLDRADFS